MSRRREEGLALVLVMTVVLALAVVATPFVLSMLLQERSGTVARFDSQAEYGAEGAKNYAMWRLMLSVDPLERRYGTGVFSTYTHDTRNEFYVRLDDQYLSQPQVQFGDPRGVIWGISLQDEQGKLNLRSAPQQMLASLSQAVDGRPGTYTGFLQNGVADLKDYLTMYSGRDASWIAPQRIRPVGHETGTPAGGVTVDNLHFLGKGARVRARKPGLRPLETRVSGNSIVNSTGQDAFSTDQSLAPYVWGVIEVEQRHPVNLNTARRETLVALFEGVRIFGVPQSLVDRDAAMQLATRFSGGNTERLEQFLQALASAPLNGPQKAAVALNAVCPTAALLDGSGTLPVAFKSYDFHSIEATASVNTPAGTEAAGRGFREIVSVSPPSLLQRACESQFDFVQMLNLMQVALQGIQPKLAFSGYPYGNRMHAYPNPVTMESDTALKNRQAPGREAYVTMVPSVDHRGRSALYFLGGSPPFETYENELQGWTGDAQYAREHYDNEMDGKKVGAEGGAWTKYFGLNHRQSQVPALGNQRPDTAAGGIEFWAKFDAVPTGLNLFDIREADTMNRVTLRVEGTDLVLTVCDGTMGLPNNLTDNGSAEVRQPFSPPTDTWIHIGAYWRSTRMGQLALLVDGLPHARQKFQHKNPENQDLLTKLSGGVDASSTTLSLANSSHLTGPTPLLVGSEVILYDPGASPQYVRAARGTTGIAHTAQVPVSVWGYTSKLKNDSYRVQFHPNFGRNIPCTKLGRTDARLSYNFQLNPQAQVVGDKNPTGMQFEIDATQADIGVIGNVMDFPDQGFIRIQGEVIFYTARSTGALAGAVGSTGKFTGCQRGYVVKGVPTVAATHASGANVDMWSVAVTNRMGFDDEGILQLGEEWFGPLQGITHQGRDYWLPYLDTSVNPARPLRLLRGLEVFGTIQNAHSAGDKVIPTFLSKCLEDWPPNIQPMGRNDWITLTDGGNQRDLRRVLMTNPANPPSTQTWPDPANFPNQYPQYTLKRNHQLAALDDFVTRDYAADDLHVRALKFPSGELLSRTWLDLANPQVSVGGWSGHIDEQKGFTVPRLMHHLNAAAGADDTNLQLTQPAGFMPQGGLIKIGDEYIGYGTAQAASLSGGKRGWLNSTKEVHDLGDPVFYLPWAPVSSLQSNVTAQDRTFYLNQGLIGDLSKYTRLYALLDRELVLLEWMSPTGGNAWDPRTYTMPPKFDGTSGLYRGMFGTPVEGHSSTDTLVYGLPWRYWDTYKAKEFDNTMAYFQWSTKLELAQWRNLRWMQELPQGEQNIVVHALVRMDGMGEFWDPPAMSDMTALMESTTPGGPINLKRLGHQNDAGQLDVRFYTEYRPNSFDAQAPEQAHSWKRIPKIKEIRVDYDRPSRVLYHEDR